MSKEQPVFFIARSKAEAESVVEGIEAWVGWEDWEDWELSYPSRIRLDGEFTFEQLECLLMVLKQRVS